VLLRPHTTARRRRTASGVGRTGDDALKIETLAVHAYKRSHHRAVAVPIYQTASYAFDNAQHGADLFDLKVAGNIYPAS
jgi:O-acetylhomoserine/O-acetylserine sulfhydrylase-like pyridoxal-dependent enzyme